MKLKHLLRYPLDIRRANRILISNSGNQLDSPLSAIGLDLYTYQMLFDCGRHLACIAAHSAKIESQIVIRCSRVILAAIAHKPLGRRFLAMENVRWIEPSSRFPDHSIVLMDINHSQSKRELKNQRAMTMLIGRDVIKQTPVMPYPMHPNQISELTDQRIESLRNQVKAGMFFAGNQQDRYGRNSLQNGFGIMPRLQILTALRREFPERIATCESESDGDGIVLRNSATDPIAAGDWMSVVARHQFFLCCPGASQPVCHNAIESMAVGTIPILEYADRMKPGLIDGVNAIFFRGRAGLIQAIDRIDTMSTSERQTMSQRVCDYYDQHLDGAKFLGRLRDDSELESAHRLSMPFHDRNLFSSESLPRSDVSNDRVRAA